MAGLIKIRKHSHTYPDMTAFLLPLALLAGWLADRLWGDPARGPHPVVAFGRWIAFWERRTNHGTHRRAAGAILAVTSIVGTYGLTWIFLLLLRAFGARIMQEGLRAGWTIPGLDGLPDGLCAAGAAVLIFYGLAGTTLIREVREVFRAVDRSTEEGRRQVARIVGRNTEQLDAQEIRTAALETLAENLSDGVIAPLFWLFAGGVPGMMAYKMVNTLDSMIGYRTERYRDFGRWAARIDDAANYIPARLTALLLLLAGTLPHRGTPTARPLKEALRFVLRNGPRHASPNSGWPEAALAAVLDCRFGGPHHYFGQYCNKPFIGTSNRRLSHADMECAVALNRYAETGFVVVLLLLMGCL